MRDLEILMNPNILVKYLKKPASEFTKYDIIKFIDDHHIQMLNFRYVGEDGKLKTLNFVITSKDYLESILSTGERVDGSSLFTYIDADSSDLYVIPRFGKDAGKVIRVASGPKDSELTGPWFSPDGKTLFLSVQHPGSKTKDLNNPTSKWPFDPDGIPKPAVVAITGDLIEKMNKLREQKSVWCFQQMLL